MEDTMQIITCILCTFPTNSVIYLNYVYNNNCALLSCTLFDGILFMLKLGITIAKLPMVEFW